MVVHLDITLEIAINHLPNGRGPVYLESASVHMLYLVNSPGNLMTLTLLPSSTNLCSRSLTCVVLPLRSNPSRTMNAPLTAEEAGAGDVPVAGSGPEELAMAAVARSLMEAIESLLFVSYSSRRTVSRDLTRKLRGKVDLRVGGRIHTVGGSPRLVLVWCGRRPQCGARQVCIS